jgi:hypothetical protein
MPVYPAENGYAIRGIAPRDLKDHPESVRLMYWSWIVEIGLRAKDKELSQGLDANGKPLRAISAATRKHRRSAMTPSGKGDPSAPPLMPARALSRTRSLLSGRAYPDHAEYWWRFDAFTGDSWARTLEKQRDRWGRDVFGVSPKAQKLIQARSYELWDRWKRGLPVAQVRAAIIPMAPAVQAPPPERAGLEDWRRLFAQPAKAAQPGRPGAPGNVLLRHIFGEKPAPPVATPIAVVPPKPKPPTMARVAMPPKPKPIPGEPIEPDKPIAERIKLSGSVQDKLKAIGKVRDSMQAAIADRKAAQAAMTAFWHAHPDFRMVSGDPDTQAFLALEEAFAKAVERIGQVTAETRTRIDKILNVSKADRQAWDHRDGQTGWEATTDAAKARKDAGNWLQSKLRKSPGGSKADAIRLIWKHEPASRGWANSGNDQIMVPTEGNRDLTVHEMGHHVEFQVDGVKGVAREFLAHRVGNQPLRKLKELFPDTNYKDDEEGRDDDFGRAFGAGSRASWYVGKHYQGATEIVSMGLEKLHADPLGFARDDPEYAGFILGILDGSLRKSSTWQPLQPVVVTKKSSPPSPNPAGRSPNSRP